MNKQIALCVCLGEFCVCIRYVCIQKKIRNIFIKIFLNQPQGRKKKSIGKTDATHV